MSIVTAIKEFMAAMVCLLILLEGADINVEKCVISGKWLPQDGVTHVGYVDLLSAVGSKKTHSFSLNGNKQHRCPNFTNLL